MAQKTKIKKDKLGLYVLAGGYITRPFFGTMFNEGDEVKSHHFGGSTKAGVTFNDPAFKFNKEGSYEMWLTTGIISYAYDKKEFEPNKYVRLFGKSYNTFDEYLKLNTEWYKNQEKGTAFIYEEMNEEFKKKNSNLE